GFGFVDGFLVLGFGSRIVDPAAARLNVGGAILEQGGADGDAAVQVAVEGEVSDASAVGAARGLFQFGNDLHGPDFGSAAQGAGGEGRAHQIVRGAPGGEESFDVRDNM